MEYIVTYSGGLVMLWSSLVACGLGASVKINAIRNSAKYLNISAQNLIASSPFRDGQRP